MSIDLTHHVLELDELFCSAQRRDERERLGSTMPTWQRDQFDAAAKQTLNGAVRTVLRTPGFTAHWASFRQFPGWVRLGMLSALVNYVSGTGQTCSHAPSPDRPCALFACAWKPEAFTCIPCAPMLFPAAGSAADHTCDGCGRECPPGGDALIIVRTYFLGPLTYSAGQCPDCLLDPAAGPNRTEVPRDGS